MKNQISSEKSNQSTKRPSIGGRILIVLYSVFVGILALILFVSSFTTKDNMAVLGALCSCLGLVLASNSLSAKPKKIPRFVRVTACIILLGVASCSFESTISNTEIQATDVKETKSLLASEMNLTNEQETAVQNIFNECGILEVSSIDKFQDGIDTTSYWVYDEETKSYAGAQGAIVVYITNDSKEVSEIYFNDNTVYENGQVVNNITNLYVSNKAREVYYTTCIATIEKTLTYPDSAEYEAKNEWRYGVIEGYDVIQTSVKAKNAFGMESTSEYQFKYDRSTLTCVSIIIDGTEYLNN